jgi:hypothetical protein
MDGRPAAKAHDGFCMTEIDGDRAALGSVRFNITENGQPWIVLGNSDPPGHGEGIVDRLLAPVRSTETKAGR